MTVVTFPDGKSHADQPRSDSKRRTRCGLRWNPAVDRSRQVDDPDTLDDDLCRKCFPVRSRRLETVDTVEATGPTDPARVPVSRMPDDPRTVEVLASQLDTWWASLNPGQKMTAMLRASS